VDDLLQYAKTPPFTGASHTPPVFVLLTERKLPKAQMSVTNTRDLTSKSKSISIEVMIENKYDNADESLLRGCINYYISFMESIPTAYDVPEDGLFDSIKYARIQMLRNVVPTLVRIGKLGGDVSKAFKEDPLKAYGDVERVLSPYYQAYRRGVNTRLKASGKSTAR